MNIYYGICEDRIDPLKLGRVRVRIIGLHSDNKQDLPTSDLPFAMVMQPTNSAANSGIGHSPTGILEGTWCMLVFRDPDLQSAVVIGTLPGIPSAEAAPIVPSGTGAITSSTGTVWTDGSGNPINSGVGAPQEVDLVTASGISSVKKPSALTTSDDGIAFLHSLEGLSSLVAGKNKIGQSSTPSTTIIYAYQDTKDIWTIGWGNTFLKDNSPVTALTSLTKAECDDLFILKLRSDYEKSARRLIKVPVTQSMFDACVTMIYNMGASGFASTQILPALNLGKYAEAAAFIPLSLINKGVLTGRRNKEKTFFLKDGIPLDDGTTTPVLITKEEVITPPDATQNPVVIRSAAPDSSVNSKPNTTPVQLSEPGFADPNKKYPRFLNEPDTHRLARHENIDGTIVVKKESARATNIATASGATWSQPPIPYNASYPYNNVYSSESGHIQEFDDTSGSERIHLYHKAGTYTEVDVNGTQVNRIVGDSFSIMERNGNIIIRGTCNITVAGDANLRVENNTTIESLGNLDIKVGGHIGIGAGGDIRLSSAGGISVDGTRIDFNSGLGGGVPKASGTATGAAAMSSLTTPTRQDHLNYVYETPEDGDPTVFIEAQVAAGNIDPDEPVVEKVKEAETVIPPTIAPGIDPASCDLIMSEKSFTFAYKLTDSFTLKDIIKGTGAEIPTGTNYGLSPQQIICNLKQLTINIIDPIKRAYPNLIITNTWRSEAKNKAIGGVAGSDHLSGQAVDIQFNGFSRQQTYDACVAIQKLLPAYHKILLEYRGSTMWIHIAYKQIGNAMQIFTFNNNSVHTRNAFVLLT